MAKVSGPTYDFSNPPATAASQTSSSNPGELGKNDFLQLMVTQLKYQDPLNPTDNQQFIAQMAQFSALEQMQNLNTSFTTNKALNLVGKYVEGTIDKDGKNQLVRGNVDSVKVSGSNAYAVINGVEVPVDDISAIAEAANKSIDLSQYTGFVGKNVKAFVGALDEDEAYQLGGTVAGIKLVASQGVEVPVAILNGVNAKIDKLDSTVQLGDGTVKDYLESKIGKSITVTVEDSAGAKSTMTGTIVSVSGDDANPNVVFDGVNTTVNSIYQVGNSQ